MGKTIAVTSGKGGTGKSTVAVGIAMSFSRLGKKVLLIDLDAGLRCLDLMLGIDERVVFDLWDVLNGRPLEDAVYPAANHENVFLIPAPAKYKELSSPDFRELLKKVNADYDITILDFPAGIDFRLYEALLPKTQMITVCNPDPVSVRDAAVVCENLPTFEKAPVFILNKFTADKIRNGIYQNIDSIIDSSGFRLLGIIPESSDLLLIPVRHNVPNRSKGAKALLRISKRLNGDWVPLPKPKRI